MRTEILGLLKYRGEKKLVVKNQDVNDIIKTILDKHKEHANEYDKIYHLFLRSSEVLTLKAIFDFLKQNVKYSIETSENQKIKSPGAIIYTGKTTGSDCKGYASFINGVVDSINRSGKMKIPFCYRFSSYKIIDNTPQHVFAVAYPSSQNEIWIDPVLPFFDQRKKYYSKVDKMPLYTLSGFEIGATRRQARKQKRAAKKVKRKQRRAARRYGENCKGRTGPKVAPPLIAGRKAFLLLVRVNFRKLGKRLVLGLRNPQTRGKILEQWCKFGGNAALLKQTAAKVERKLIAKKQIVGEIDNFDAIGVEPTTLTTALALASPILAAISKFLPAGSTAQEITETASEVAEQVADETTDQDAEMGCAANCGCRDSIVSGMFSFGNLPLILAAGVGLYFLTKK